MREGKLAKRFGVSRGPIRDVLLQLTQEGLLISKPNCGVRVGDSLDEPTQPLIIQLRQTIEVFALEEAFESLDEEAIKHMEEMVENLRIPCETGNLAEIVEHDMAFHRYILELTGNEKLIAIWLPIVQRMMLHYTRHGDIMENYKEHAGILKAIREKNLKRAVKALKQNIQ